MTYEEFDRFFANEIHSRWPDWKPTASQRTDCRRAFEAATYDEARAALENYVLSPKASTARPNLGFCKHILDDILAKGGRSGGSKQWNVLSGWYVECVDNDIPGRVGWRQPVCVGRPEDHDDPDRIAQYALALAHSCQNLYGGQFVVIRPDDPQAQGHSDAEIDPDNKLVGPPALAAAVQRILSGPDTPGRRWLLAQHAEGTAPASLTMAIEATLGVKIGQPVQPLPKSAPGRRQECMFEGQAPSAPTKPQVAAQEPEDEFDRFIREHKGVDDSLPF